MNHKHPLLLLLQGTLTVSFAPLAYEQVESIWDGDAVHRIRGESKILGWML